MPKVVGNIEILTLHSYIKLFMVNFFIAPPTEGTIGPQGGWGFNVFQNFANTLLVFVGGSLTRGLLVVNIFHLAGEVNLG